MGKRALGTYLLSFSFLLLTNTTFAQHSQEFNNFMQDMGEVNSTLDEYSVDTGSFEDFTTTTGANATTNSSSPASAFHILSLILTVGSIFFYVWKKIHNR